MVKGFLMSAIWIAVAVIVLYIIFAGSLFIFQSNYIYYPERELSLDPSSIGLDFQSIAFETEEGLKLSGWFVPSTRVRGVILFCHGNAGNISHRLDSIQLFHQLSYRD